MIDLDLAMAEVASGREGRGAGTGAVKRRYSPSGYAQEKAVVFEASEGQHALLERPLSMFPSTPLISCAINAELGRRGRASHSPQGVPDPRLLHQS